MMPMRQRDKPADPDAARIAAKLDEITRAGQRPDTIFDDWLEMMLTLLERMPEHLKSLRDNGWPAEDTPAGQALWARLRQRYPAWAFEKFKEAYHLLHQAAADGEYRDLLGQIYMAWGWPNDRAGQFFTADEICRFMAQLTAGDIEGQIKARVLAAAAQSPVAQAALLTRYAIDDAGAATRWFFERVLPACAEFIESIRVLDCCCGSGAMFLGFASVCPAWALEWGLIQFYGQDIDMTCVLMAKVNLMIHSLNGYWVKSALVLTEAELQQLPQPVAEIYREAQSVADDPARLAELAQVARIAAGQLSMFAVDPADAAPLIRRHPTRRVNRPSLAPVDDVQLSLLEVDHA